MLSTSLNSEARRAARQRAIGLELYQALRARRMVAPLSSRDGDALTIDDAYAASQALLEHRLAAGEIITGKKIGATSKAVQDMLGIGQPDFGFLTDRMAVADGATIEIAQSGLIQPRAEAEIAFILRDDLHGPGVSESDVLAATGTVAPCFEIVDSRIRDWQIGIVDTIADNASCGMYVIGAAREDPRGLDLPSLHVTVRKNGSFLSEGWGSAVQGSPLTAVAWLANTLGAYGVKLQAGEVILSGSLVPLEPVRPGDFFEMNLPGLGGCSVSFR